MAKTDIFNKNWVEMVFEGRNQEYGAYELRKNGERNIILGIILAIVFFTLTVSMPMILSWLEGLKPKEEIVKVTDVNKMADIPPPPPDEAAPPPPPPPPPLKATIKFTPPVIKEEVPEEDVPPPQEELAKAEVSTVTQEGDANGVPEGLGEGNAVVEEAAPQVFTIVEQMPEFTGGDAARMKFIQEKTVYPPLAKENGIQGTVYVQFVVNAEGKIGDVKVIRGIGGGCDEEAVRVVKMMPPWKPGKQNGRPVFVQFNMPFKFSLK